MPITDIFNPPQRPPTSPRAQALQSYPETGNLLRMKQYIDARDHENANLDALSAMLGGANYAIDYPWESVKNVGEFAQDIPSMVKGWLDRTVGNPNYGTAIMMGDPEAERATTDIASMVPAAGLLGARPPGSIGMFAGRRAETADKQALGKAMSMESQGADRTAIWNDTGWFKGADDQWRFEIDDSAMRLTDPSPQDQVGWGVAGEQSALQHPELAEAYPAMQNIHHLISGKGTGGSYQVPQGRYMEELIAEGSDPAARRSTALHEMQHATQQQEGFATGGDYREFVPDVKSELAILGDEVKNINSRMREAIGTPEYENLMGMRSNVVKRIQELEGDYGDPRKYAYDQYRRLAGEAEARNVQARRDFTPEQRAAQPPWQTLDVPEDELIVRTRGEGPSMSDELLMDEASRMARAQEMGFDENTQWFRGVSGDYPIRYNSMWTTDPSEASAYSMGSALTNTGDQANVIPAMMKAGKGRNIDDEIMNAIMEGYDPDNVAAKIMVDEGLDYVEFYHPSASSQDDHLVRVVLDPKNIRSRFAQFDPAQSESADILAMNAPAAAVPGVITQSLQSRMTPEDWAARGGI